MVNNTITIIDGNEYDICPFFGLQGWNIQTRLGALIGPGVAELIAALPEDAKKGKVSALDFDMGKAGGAIHKILYSLATNDPRGEFVELLLSKTQRNGALLTRAGIDTAFAQNYLEMGKAIFEVIRANNFFELGNSGFLSALQNMAGQTTGD